MSFTQRSSDFRPCQVSLLSLSLVLAFAGHAPCQKQGQKQGQAPGQSAAQSVVCSVDLTNPGTMKDILSNALRRGLHIEETRIRRFLAGAEDGYERGAAMLEAAAKHFRVDAKVLRSRVLEYEHCNCSHPGARHASAGQDTVATRNEPVSDFAKNVTLHVALHELGHALIREFDLPVLGNEETMADAFATHYLTKHMPKRAAEVLQARIESLTIEARELPRAEWTVRGEHNSDARRAFQIAALAIAADRSRYAPLARLVGMSDSEVRKSADYGAEIHRSWRRVLRPLWMPRGQVSNEAAVKFDAEDRVASELEASGLHQELRAVLGRFDWHSMVKLHFAAGDGGAGWSRSRRTITIRSGYVRRFIKQGKQRGAR